ncbi:hypothetical protein ACFPRL_36185 [Pseudoclavibacter helvolus]
MSAAAAAPVTATAPKVQASRVRNPGTMLDEEVFNGLAFAIC